MGLVDFSLGDIGNLFTNIREAITGKKILDPNEQAKITLELAKLEQVLQQGQIDINKAEASNPNWFVAGWRPSIGWTGSLAIFYFYIAQPTIEWICKLQGIDVTPPHIDSAMLFNLVIAMLGLGGFRTFEKLKDVHEKH